ncbi:MAG: ABC transporter ATP-binding protein [Patescibacteria group bacterium]|nr:ABC transporter ATP-binding protein [Patescibacteria group bacterium]MDE1988309.1 ABC transporter ATP-binding protein [Patescibacteria group bacterium]MDE2218326.1 ABC transporter ATP-binding protein [Patescibacteria group bacterium]
MIQIKNLGKKYDIRHQKGRYVTLRDVLVNIFKNPFRFARQKAKEAIGISGKEEFWALKNINLEIKKGEVIGIIGGNGAGKSTLLKILSRITPPTIGEIRINGTVSSLLEVGTGFHPELTGRENIFLNGAILGMTREEMAKKFDAIVEFAGIEKFLDTQVKHYSSGMYVRLAFSVAAHLEPDILIVDEVLAVGDAEFQKKCLGKMDEITKKEGRTILFVSHNMASIQSLCNRCLLLDAGKIIKDDTTIKTIDFYLHGFSKNKKEVVLAEKKEIPAQVLKIKTENEKGELISEIQLGEDVILSIEYSVNKKIDGFNVGTLIFKDDIPVFYSLDSDEEERLLTEAKDAGFYISRIKMPTSLLKEGEYDIQVVFGGVEEHYNQNAFIRTSIINTSDNLTNKSYRSDRRGIIYKKIKWETKKI